MAERRFYCQPLREGHATLVETEAHHASHVVRIRAGQTVRLFDGQGLEALAVVESVGRGKVELLVSEVIPSDSSTGCQPITVSVPMPKGDRADFLVEKLTELGVQEIWPLLSGRTVVEPGSGKLEHWRRVSISAAKQSRRSFLPKIASPISISELIGCFPRYLATMWGSVRPDAKPLLAHLRTILPESDRLSARQAGLSAQGARGPEDKSVLIIIGPEGGWEEAEESLLMNAGAVPVSLGASVLRVETAAMVVVAVTAAWLESGCPPSKPNWTANC